MMPKVATKISSEVKTTFCILRPYTKCFLLRCRRCRTLSCCYEYDYAKLDNFSNYLHIFLIKNIKIK